VPPWCASRGSWHEKPCGRARRMSATARAKVCAVQAEMKGEPTTGGVVEGSRDGARFELCMLRSSSIAQRLLHSSGVQRPRYVSCAARGVSSASSRR